MAFFSDNIRNFAKNMLLRIMIDTSVFQDKTAVYYTLGCKLNFSETSTIGRMLEERGVTATVRRTLGSDIEASCGQLRRKVEGGTGHES